MTRPAVLYPALVVGFLLVRAGLFAVTTAGEYRLFRDYGEAARSAGLADLYRTRDVEYPHLAVLFGAAPAWLADRLPGWAPGLVRFRPNKHEWPYTEESAAERDAGDRYEVALGLVLFAVDAASLALVWLIARRVYPHETPLARVGRLMLYVVATSTVGLILYDRQDPVVGLVALLAVWALADGRPRVGYAVLAAGAAFKLVPALLLPVWVFAAAAARPGHFGRRVVTEAAIAGAVLAAWPALTYVLGGGERGFVFLTYHADRGLQLEAPVAWPVFLLDSAARVGHGHGSYNVTGELAARVAAVAKWLMLLALPVTVGVAASGFWRAARSPVEPVTLVPHVVASALLVWLGFIAANKVGSPQYLHWVLPLVPLLPLRAWTERGWVALLLVAGGLTTLVFPCFYPLIYGPRLPTDPVTWGGPSAFGLFLLAARSVTLIAAAVWLGRRVWRGPRAPAGYHFGGPPVIPAALLAAAVAAPADIPTPAPTRSDEPVAKAFSPAKAAAYLDGVGVGWTRERKCITCHTNLPYLLARPHLPGAAGVTEVRKFLEADVASWSAGGKPRGPAYVVATALGLAATDAHAGKLTPVTRAALDRMWKDQRADGAWNWLKCDWPPMEHDDYYGATLGALAAGVAPEGYAKSDAAAAGLEKLRGYLTKTAAPDLHHRAMLLWASTKVDSLLPADRQKGIVAELKAAQRADGGWCLPALGEYKRRDEAKTPNDPAAPSDGYGTGFAVYVLRQAGVPTNDSAVARGVVWLRSNQRESGRWYTRSLSTDRAHYITNAGSAFAVLALAACGEMTGGE